MVNICLYSDKESLNILHVHLFIYLGETGVSYWGSNSGPDACWAGMWPTEPRLQPSNLNDSLFQISLGFARGPNMSLFIQQMFSENLPVVRLHVDMDQVEVLPVPWYLRDSLNS